MQLSTIFQLYRGGGNRSTRRKLPTCRKSLKTLSHNVVSNVPCLSRIRKTLVVIGTDYICSYKFYYHTIMTTMALEFYYILCRPYKLLLFIVWNVVLCTICLESQSFFSSSKMVNLDSLDCIILLTVFPIKSAAEILILSRVPLKAGYFWFRSGISWVSWKVFT